jgi:hypothetical protein
MKGRKQKEWSHGKISDKKLKTYRLIILITETFIRIQKISQYSKRQKVKVLVRV